MTSRHQIKSSNSSTTDIQKLIRKFYLYIDMISSVELLPFYVPFYKR